MPRAFVAFGSNVRPRANVVRALRRLGGIADVRAVATFWRTPPQGTTDQAWFVNGVVEVATDLARDALQARLHGIEDALGRVRGADPNGPRTIDLDVVAYDDGKGAWLAPDVDRYPFVSGPLAEIAPGLPVTAAAPLEGSSPLRALTARLCAVAAKGRA